MKALSAYVSRRSGHPMFSVDPDTEKVDIVHTEAPSCHVGRHHTHHRSHRLSLQNEKHRNDTNPSDRDSYILRERNRTQRHNEKKRIKFKSIKFLTKRNKTEDYPHDWPEKPNNIYIFFNLKCSTRNSFHSF